MHDVKREASQSTSVPQRAPIKRHRVAASREPIQEAATSVPARAKPTPPFKAVSVRIPTAAAMLGIGRTKLYELISSGEIDLIKIGKVSLIAVGALEAFVERQERASDNSGRRPASRGRPRKSFTELIR